MKNVLLQKLLASKRRKSKLRKVLLLMRLQLMIRERNYVTRDCLRQPIHGVLSDSAFPVSGDCFRRIMTPLKENEEFKIVDPVARQMALKVRAAITSMRQPAEWGMGALVGANWQVLFQQ
jgi:hypothetical protein